MIGELCPHGLGSEHVEGPRDEESLMADLRPAKGASLELIPFDAGTDPRQVDGCRGAFTHCSPEGLEPEVHDCNAVPTQLRSTWMPHMLGLCSKIEDSKSTIMTARVAPFN